MAAPNINRRKEAMRILFSDELAEKDKEINTIKQKYHKKIEELKKIEDLNTPQAQKILDSMLQIN